MLPEWPLVLVTVPSFDPGAMLSLPVMPPDAVIFWLRLVCALHEVNREYAELANMTEHFNAAYTAFVQWWVKTYHPKTGEAGFKGYYLSAYAIAQKHGYNGTESEWLASLKGDKGDTGAAFTYDMFTAAQLETLKVKGDKGDKGDTGAKGDPGADGAPGKDGADGAPGKDGANGHTPVITATKSGKVTTIKSDGEEIATVNDGADGAPGKDGADGKPGEKGDKGDTGDPGSDYVLTDADKSEIAALVLAQIPDGDEVAYG